MEFLEKIKTYINNNHLFSKKDDLLLAISGGIDSVTAAHSLTQLGYTVSFAHCNFQLRDEESDRDEAFVQSLAESLAIPLFIERYDTQTYALEHNLSIQEAARDLRYNFFRTAINPATNKPFSFIITAHNMNDTAETAIHHLAKGTGLRGMRGIPTRNDNIVRPLLCVSRQEIVDFATANNINYVEDSSNSLPKYLRNFIRQNVMPEITTLFKSGVENIYNTTTLLTDATVLYDEIVAQKIKKICTKKCNEIHIPILLLLKEKAHKALLYEIMQPYGFSAKQTNEALQLVDAENSSYVSAEKFRIIKNRNWLIIAPNDHTDSSHIIIEYSGSTTPFALGKLCISETNQLFTNPFDVTISADDLQYPLVLRPAKEGDYFYPLGMNKKKKIARFLIDKKLSAVEKKQIWVLCSNDRIVWVVGYRIDNRFAITDKTQVKLNLLVKRQ